MKSAAITGAKPGWKKPTRQNKAVKRSTWRKSAPQPRQAAQRLALSPRWLRCSCSRKGCSSQTTLTIGRM